jgi:hypothetical protein
MPAKKILPRMPQRSATVTRELRDTIAKKRAAPAEPSKAQLAKRAKVRKRKK